MNVKLACSSSLVMSGMTITNISLIKSVLFRFCCLEIVLFFRLLVIEVGEPV
jgi:hypothetical protein